MAIKRMLKVCSVLGFIVFFLGLLLIAILWYPLKKYKNPNVIQLSQELFQKKYYSFWKEYDFSMRYNSENGICELLGKNYTVSTKVNGGTNIKYEGKNRLDQENENYLQFLFPVDNGNSILFHENSRDDIKIINDNPKECSAINIMDNDTLIMAKLGMSIQNLREKISQICDNFYSIMYTVADNVYMVHYTYKIKQTQVVFVGIVFGEILLMLFYLYWKGKMQ